MIRSQVYASKRHVIWTTDFLYDPRRCAILNDRHKDDHDVLSFLVRGVYQSERKGGVHRYGTFSLTRPHGDPDEPITLRALSDVRMVCVIPRDRESLERAGIRGSTRDRLLEEQGYTRTTFIPRYGDRSAVRIEWRGLA